MAQGWGALKPGIERLFPLRGGPRLAVGGWSQGPSTVTFLGNCMKPKRSRFLFSLQTSFHRHEPRPLSHDSRLTNRIGKPARWCIGKCSVPASFCRFFRSADGSRTRSRPTARGWWTTKGCLGAYVVLFSASCLTGHGRTGRSNLCRCCLRAPRLGFGKNDPAKCSADISARRPVSQSAGPKAVSWSGKGARGAGVAVLFLARHVQAR